MTWPRRAGVPERTRPTLGRGRERAIASTAFGATEEPLRRVWGPRRRLWRQIWRAFRPRCHARAHLAHAMRPQRSSVLLSRAWPGRFRVPPSLVLAVSGIPVNWLFIWFTGIPLLGYAQEDKSPPAGCLLAGPPGGSSPLSPHRILAADRSASALSVLPTLTSEDKGHQDLCTTRLRKTHKSAKERRLWRHLVMYMMYTWYGSSFT